MPTLFQELALKYALTASSAIVAETATYPIDTVKTRLQLQGQQGAGSSRRGVLEVTATALRKEGLAGLYVGLPPALIRHVFYSGTRITVYELLKERLQQDGSTPGLAMKLGMGLTAGAIGQLVAVPADLIKVRMQADARAVAAGLQSTHRYHGVVDAFRTIVAKEGGLQLWRGASPAVQRAALVNLGELATYDQAKQLVLSTGIVGDNVMAHSLSSVCSGFFAAVVSTPADVVKTRMMSQDAAAPLYSSSLHCLRSTIRNEGLLAMYKGFIPTWARLGPWQLVFWTSYERLRGLAELPSF